MAANYLHGVETISVQKGTRPIQVVKSSVIAIVGTAPIGSTNQPTLVLSENDAAQFGNKLPGFTIPQALEAIYKQGPATVVVVNVFDKLKNAIQVFNESKTIANGKAKLDSVPVADLVLSNSPSVTGETKATATMTVTAIGSNDDLTVVYAYDEIFGFFKLAVYTKISSDDTAAKVATAIASLVNAGTSGHGYTASAASATVTITARAGLGTSQNGNELYSVGGVTATFSNFTGGANGSATITTYTAGTDYTVDTLGNILIVSGSSISEGATIKASYKKLDAGSITNAQVIGAIDSLGNRTGMKVWELIYATYGFTPKVLIAPGFSHISAIATELIASTSKYRAHCLLDAPEGTTVSQAIAGRGISGTIGGFNTSNKRALLCYPMVKVYDSATDSNVNAPLSQFAAGVMSNTDFEEGYWYSPSNHEIKGIVGLERVITAGINNASSEANLLNEKGIITVFNSFGTGFRLWGNRASSWPTSTTPDNFIPVQRVADILAESIEYSMLDFIDKPINNATIDAIKESVNSFIRTLIGRGALIDGICKFDKAKNPDTEIALGHLVFDIDFMPPTPAERITFNHYIDISLLKSLAA